MISHGEPESRLSFIKKYFGQGKVDIKVISIRKISSPENSSTY